MRRQRKPTWRADLTAFIDKSRDKPFKWGSFDCALWASSAFKVVTGYDPAKGFRGAKYSTAAGALKALKVAGFDSPQGIAVARVGPEKPIAFAMPGDMVAADLEALGLTGGERQIGLSLGICNGALSYFVSEAGLVELPTLKMKCAFDG